MVYIVRYKGEYYVSKKRKFSFKKPRKNQVKQTDLIWFPHWNTGQLYLNINRIIVPPKLEGKKLIFKVVFYEPRRKDKQ